MPRLEGPTLNSLDWALMPRLEGPTSNSLDWFLPPRLEGPSVNTRRAWCTRVKVLRYQYFYIQVWQVINYSINQGVRRLYAWYGKKSILSYFLKILVWIFLIFTINFKNLKIIDFGEFEADFHDNLPTFRSIYNGFCNFSSRYIKYSR